MHIYLISSFDPSKYIDSRSLLRDLSDALTKKYGYTVSYVHGRTRTEATPDALPDAQECLSLARRMLEGGLYHPRPDAAWTVGGAWDSTVEDQCAAAEDEGIVIGEITDAEVTALLHREVKKAQVHELKPKQDKLRLSVEWVLQDFFSGAEGVVGCRAQQYEPRIPSGKAYSDVDAGLRIAVATTVMQTAAKDQEWASDMLPFLSLVYKGGHSMSSAAQKLGWAGTQVALRKRAQRMHDKAMGCISRAIQQRMS